MHWHQLVTVLQQSAHQAGKLSSGERRACVKILLVVRALNDQGCYPAAMRDHLPPALASQAQALAAKLPCLLESWPRYRVTQLGRAILRDERALSYVPEED